MLLAENLKKLTSTSIACAYSKLLQAKKILRKQKESANRFVAEMYSLLIAMKFLPLPNVRF